MKIYWIKAQAPRRVLALVKHLGIAAELVEMDLMAGGLRAQEYVALNPNKKVPTLVDGDLVLWEASAIMAYLCIKAGSDMWPAHNPSEQVEVLRWLSWNDGHWSPAVAPFYFEHVVKSTFGIGAPDHELLKSSIADFNKFAKVLNSHLQDRNYVAFERLTIADFQLASMAHYWRESEMPMQAFPHIVRWLDTLKLIPAWADPWPAPNHTTASA
ncbi:glutathione S-transferase family protein [Pseudolysobacter antarcticus]|uniref:Glutathione S-transferase family protein n=1 Tax=Pseudolysobacter antarcticus TaxID=2511995 RepID=A0A411HPP2_9GAMM|nr:glutathione S-transferase family protein [Pseudolysobacter antarcticus]QBB72444.1 glutathione S-transferase family protein [Pseudolysobacter antarcticus]